MEASYSSTARAQLPSINRWIRMRVQVNESKTDACNSLIQSFGGRLVPFTHVFMKLKINHALCINCKMPLLELIKLIKWELKNLTFSVKIVYSFDFFWLPIYLHVWRALFVQDSQTHHPEVSPTCMQSYVGCGVHTLVKHSAYLLLSKELLAATFPITVNWST